MTDYVKVARRAELKPGTMKCVTLGRRRVLLVHAEDGIHAVDELCTHEDASLALGCIQGDRIKCPLHGSRFDLRTGEALDEPAEVPLAVHEVKLEGDDIFVRLGRTQ